MNQKAYLQRIGIPPGTPLPPTAATLRYLQHQHLLHVPFENIDIQCRVPLALYPDAFFDKIVTRGRGGYCYECNGLFYWLLEALGFQVRMISCRVAQRKNIGPEFDHLALLVAIDGREWLADAGFGEFSIAPVLLSPPGSTCAGLAGNYSIQPYGSLDGTIYLSAVKQSGSNSTPQPVYLFTTQPRALSDFAGMHHYHQTSPESHFTRSLICSMLTRQGRISLIKSRLIRHYGSERTEHLLYGSTAINKALAQYFGMRDTFRIPAC